MMKKTYARLEELLDMLGPDIEGRLVKEELTRDDKMSLVSLIIVLRMLLAGTEQFSSRD